MITYKEYTSKFGTFYSDWAMFSSSGERFKHNMETYHKLMDVLKIPCSDGKFRGNGDELFEYTVYGYYYGKNSYLIKTMPDWMTMEEAALIVDGGNLCFGFCLHGNIIDIYTD